MRNESLIYSFLNFHFRQTGHNDKKINRGFSHGEVILYKSDKSDTRISNFLTFKGNLEYW